MIELKTVVLENDLVRVEFLPQQGGRLYSMVDKATGKDVFLRNPVYQPANLGILDAWFSGGVEWNVAQYGHTFTSNLPVFFAKIKQGDYEFVRMYDYERCKRLFYHIDFHLPQGSRVLYAYMRMINDEPERKPTYWWTNAALPEKRNVRVFSCTDEVMFLRPESIGNIMKYEGFDFDGGIAEWKLSLDRKANPWALRNLSVAALRSGQLDEATDLMRQALELEKHEIDPAFLQEYFDLLVQKEEFQLIWDTYQALPDSLKENERLMVQAGYSAVELDKIDFVEMLVSREFAHIREGDNLLVDMWFKYAAKQEAKKRGVPFSQELYQEVRRTQLPPANIDFRMVDN